jgi:2'-5' RNA ligase
MASRLAIVAYPILNEADLAEIQAIREIHDPQFAVLTPHFTLVFPVEAPDAVVVAAAQAMGAVVPPFTFTLRSVRAVRDAVGAGGHVFLVPDDGAAQVCDLHDRLYAGALQSAHRRDIPYVPHITVAAHPNFSRCEALASEIESTNTARAGRVEALTVLGVSGKGIEELAVVALSG